MTVILLIIISSYGMYKAALGKTPWLCVAAFSEMLLANSLRSSDYVQSGQLYTMYVYAMLACIALVSSAFISHINTLRSTILRCIYISATILYIFMGIMTYMGVFTMMNIESLLSHMLSICVLATVLEVDRHARTISSYFVCFANRARL